MPLTRRKRLDARHDRRNVGQAARDHRRGRRCAAISSARSPTATCGGTSSRGSITRPPEFMTPRPEDDRAGCARRRRADLVRGAQDHGAVRGRGRARPVGVLHIHDCPPHSMNAVILIPARYASSRYPGKPLVELKGAGGAAKPLIQRSVEAARRVQGVSGVFVVTDDERIAEACAPAKGRRDHDFARMPQRDRALRRGAGAASRPGSRDQLPGRCAADAAGVRRSADRADGGRPRRVGRDARDAAAERRGAGASGGGSGRARRRNDGRDQRARPCALFLEAPDPASAAGALGGEMSPVRLHVGVYAYRPKRSSAMSRRR